jgi:hypothetical protein
MDRYFKTAEEAREAAIKIWELIAETGCSKSKAIKELGFNPGMRGGCPLCEWFSESNYAHHDCHACSEFIGFRHIYGCLCGLYQKYLFSSRRDEKRSAAAEIVKLLKRRIKP